MGNLKTKYSAVALGPNAVEEAARLGGYSVEDAERIVDLADRIYNDARLDPNNKPFHLFNAALNVLTRMLLDANPENRIKIVSAITESLVAVIGGSNDENVFLAPEDEGAV